MPLHFAQSFPPIIPTHAEILILGSIPGQASLAANEYYAHPRNAFWPIMSALFKFDARAPYLQRVEALKVARIAVWDILYSCTRPGSLDTDIDPSSLIANDMASFLRQHPAINRIFFNGSKAESCFRKHLAPTLQRTSIRRFRLPSTSPAHATPPLERKLAAWQVILARGH